MIRSAQIYTTRAIITACNLVKGEGECVEAVVERYVEEGLAREHPGLMEVINECDKAFEETKKLNKIRLDKWREVNNATAHIKT